MPTTPELPKLYTPQAAAELTGLPLRTIREALYYRRLPVHKVRGRVYVSHDALADWLAGTVDLP